MILMTHFHNYCNYVSPSPFGYGCYDFVSSVSMVVSNFSATSHGCYESPRQVPYEPKHIVDDDDDDYGCYCDCDSCSYCDYCDPGPDLAHAVVGADVEE